MLLLNAKKMRVQEKDFSKQSTENQDNMGLWSQERKVLQIKIIWVYGHKRGLWESCNIPIFNIYFGIASSGHHIHNLSVLAQDTEWA